MVWLTGSGIVKTVCDVIKQPIFAETMQCEVPSENPAEVVSNATTGRVAGPAICSVSTQTESVDDESEYDQYFYDLEERGDRLWLDFVPYKELTCRQPLYVLGATYVFFLMWFLNFLFIC